MTAPKRPRGRKTELVVTVPFKSWVPTGDEITKGEKFHSFRKGWVDGAAGRTEDMKFTEHPTRPDLTTEYRRGHSDGSMAKRRAMEIAAKRLRYDTSMAVLRGGG